MHEEARPARDEDRSAIEALHRAATAELAAERGGAVWAARADRHGAVTVEVDHPDTLVLAGTIDGAVVGYARIRAERLAGGEELAVLTDIYVDPEAREVGVGEALLDAAIEWARQRGAIGIDSVALPGMRDTKNFFESAGMVARAILVHRSLR